MRTSPSFVGREAEIEALRAALAGARAVLVSGPPGAGKTRLVREALPAAVFVPVASCQSEQDVVGALAEALGVRASDRPGVFRALGRRASPVAILDGADRVAARIQDWIGRGLSSEAEPRFVVTYCGGPASSVHPEVRLGPLTSGEAQRLWLHRAEELGFPSDPAAGEAIVQLVDRLPLAIEWTASQAALIGEPACLERVRTSSVRVGPLSGALDAVLEELSTGERRALALLSAFDRGALAPVLDHLLGSSLRDVEALVARALVHVERLPSGTGRTTPYRLVALRMRERAEEAGEWEALARAHALAVLATAEPIAAKPDGPQDDLLLMRQDLEAIAERMDESDVGLATRACLALAPIALRDEGAVGTADRLRRLLSRGGAASHAARLRLAALERRLGRFDRARHELDLVDDGGFDATLERAHVDRMQSRAESALAGYERALGLAEQSGEPAQRCTAYGELGRMLQSLGRFSEAQALHRQAAGLARSLGLPHREALERSLYARATHRAGAVGEAISLHEQALALHEQLDQPRLVAAELGHLAFCHHETGDTSRAEALYRRSLQGLAQVGDVMLEHIERTLLARLLADLGRLAEARLELGVVEGAIEHADVPRIRLTLLLVKGLCELGCGDLIAAREILEAASALGAHVEVGFEALVPAYLAHVAHRLDDRRAALAHLDAAQRRVASIETKGLRAAVAVIGALVRGEPVAPPDAEVLASSSDARRAMRLAEGQQPREGALGVARDGRSVRLPGGETFELGRHAAPRRLLIELARARETRPGEALGHEELIAVGWPGERMLAEAARKRLRTAIWTLRRWGLEPALLTRDDGYLLDPYVPFVWLESR